MDFGNSKLFSELEKNDITESMCLQKGSLADVKKKYLPLISGGYSEFHKDTEFSKESYHKIDTPWGSFG